MHLYFQLKTLLAFASLSSTSLSSLSFGVMIQPQIDEPMNRLQLSHTK